MTVPMNKEAIKRMLRMPLCRWITAFAIVTLIAVWAAAFLRVQYEYQTELNTAMRVNENLAANFMEHMQLHFDQIDGTLLFFKKQYEMNGGACRIPGASEKLFCGCHDVLRTGAVGLWNAAVDDGKKRPSDSHKAKNVSPVPSNALRSAWRLA
ncbi:MAG: hypothetical protein AB9917_11155 [Negativicutes bacterium]